MNLHKLILTENDCYKAGKKITPKGIMVHSTAANNPWLRRYVGPDDGLLGKNILNNHWNQAMSRNVCVHAFIGKMNDGTVATYQTLPWDHRGWHCSSGNNGSGNDTHISFEICEDNLKNADYFAKVYHEAVELCVYLCKEYNLTEKDIICHSEGYQKGIASNHGDVMHWFPKHGKSMDTFRADVKALLNKKEDSAPKPVTMTIKKGDVVTLDIDAVYYNGKTIPSWVKNEKWFVLSVGGDRVVIDKSVNGKYSICSPVHAMYLNVVDTSAPGAAVEKLYSSAKVDYAKAFSTQKAGTYKVNADGGLYLRAGASTNKKSIELMKNGSKVRCYGYHTDEWLYVVSSTGKNGFCHISYLKRA